MVFLLVASPLAQIGLLVFMRWNKNPFFISLMNIKSGIFTRGFATRKNSAFGVYSVK